MGSIASIGFKDTSHTLGFSLYVLTECPPLTQFPSTWFPLTQFFDHICTIFFQLCTFKDQICILFFHSRMRPRTFLQCFALYFLCSKAKHCRNVLGQVLGQKNKIQCPSFKVYSLCINTWCQSIH